MAAFPTEALDRRGDLSLWAALYSEALAQGAQYLETVERLRWGIVARGEGTPEEAARVATLARGFHPLRITSPTAYALVFDQEVGAWPNEGRVVVELALSERAGVRARHLGFPAGTKALVDPRPPSSPEEAQAVARALVVEVLRLFLPYQEPFVGTAHAGRVIAVLKTLEPTPAPKR